MKYKFTPAHARKVIKKIRASIQRYFKGNNLTYAIFGKSEGLDSSVIAGLFADLPGVKPIGVVMPCESDPDAMKIARLTLDHFKIPCIEIDLTSEFHYLMGNLYSSKGVHGQLTEVLHKYGDLQLVKSLADRKARACGNVKVRLRMITLYHIAQLTGGLVVSTDNLSEFWMGFWTLNGDVGDFAPIQQVWKGLEEYTIAEALGVPKESIEAVPTDGLDITPNGTDQEQLGLPYHELDRVIASLLKERFDGSGKNYNGQLSVLSEKLSKKLGFDAEKIADVAKRMCNTHFKRHWPIELSRADIGLRPVKDLQL